MEDEVEYLNEVADFYHGVIVNLHSRVSTLESVIVASGLTDSGNREEEIWIN